MTKTIGQYVEEIKDAEVKEICKEILAASDKTTEHMPNRKKRSELIARDEKDALHSIGIWPAVSFVKISNYYSSL